jgi:hypothetical protein
VKLMEIARTRAVLVVGVIAVGLTVAACGSSSSSTSSSSSGSKVASTGGSSTTPSASRSALRTCLAQHGVTLPNRRPSGSGGPPPGGVPGGGFFGGGGGGAGGRFNNPKFRAAIQACGGFRGGGFRGGGARFRLSHTAINSFVSCVRKNGYAAMPNPNFSSRAIFPASIRSNKQFQAAAVKCEKLLRPSRTSGSANPGA